MQVQSVWLLWTFDKDGTNKRLHGVYADADRAHAEAARLDASPYFLTSIQHTTLL